MLINYYIYTFSIFAYLNGFNLVLLFLTQACLDF